MRQLAAVLVWFLVIAGGASVAFAQSQQPYTGDKASFTAFVDRYGKTDWPLPLTIDYFDPAEPCSDPAKSSAPVIRYAHWVPTTGPVKGTIVHFNGRTEFIERNIYTYKDLLERGYEIWALDWRGQGFSRRQNKEKQKHSIDSFDTYLRDATCFIDKVAKVKESPGTKVLLAHSMGGQIALRYLLSDRGRSTFDYAVLSSPLLRVPSDDWYSRRGNWIKTHLLMGDWCVFEKPDEWVSDFKTDSCGLVNSRPATEADLADATDAKKYTHDWSKLAEINCLIESSKDAKGEALPDLRLACPTSDWLHAAFTSTDFTMENFAKLATPTLIIRAKPDAAVDNEGQTKFCELAKIACVDVESEGGTPTGHELLIEVEPIRRRFFQKFDAFVKTNQK